MVLDVQPICYMQGLQLVLDRTCPFYFYVNLSVRRKVDEVVFFDSVGRESTERYFHVFGAFHRQG